MEKRGTSVERRVEVVILRKWWDRGAGKGEASAGDALGRRGGQGGESMGGTIERAAS